MEIKDKKINGYVPCEELLNENPLWNELLRRIEIASAMQKTLQPVNANVLILKKEIPEIRSTCCCLGKCQCLGPLNSSEAILNSVAIQCAGSLYPASDSLKEKTINEGIWVIAQVLKYVSAKIRVMEEYPSEEQKMNIAVSVRDGEVFHCSNRGSQDLLLTILLNQYRKEIVEGDIKI